LDKPDLFDNMNDLDRLKLSMQKEHGIGDLEINLDILRELPENLRKKDFNITVTVASYYNKNVAVDITAGKSIKPNYGLAVDIGTTTVVINLLNLDTGKSIDKLGTYNRQSSHGSDVITRIVYGDSNRNGYLKLQTEVIDTINELLEVLTKQNKINKDDISVIVASGNTVMSHLFLGMSPKYLRLEPYIPAVSGYPVLRAKELNLDINKNAVVVTMPSVASYVGGDITSGVLTTLMHRSEKLTLLIDIGTNGEIVLGNNEWMMTCSCSAGPAFEGSGIKWGMRAMDGAIDYLEIKKIKKPLSRYSDEYIINYNTIGDLLPLGICGSGLIQLISEMNRVGIIDRSGKINESLNSSRVRKSEDGMEFVVAFTKENGCNQDIVITEADIKNLLRAKAAIFAGIRTMLSEVMLDIKDIERVYIAGGFGRFINIGDAIRIGLLPDLPQDIYTYIGNSSIQGAMIVLLSQEALLEADEIANSMTYMELSIGNAFMDEFISSVFIPHTDLSLFPSLEVKQDVEFKTG
jgi:uncharacterized 2Fe-2S/4Fe-4S cluster protein (DUF4445 family)